MLETYRAAIDKRIAAEEELQEQVSQQQTPEMQAKVTECKEAEQQLKALNEKLGQSVGPPGLFHTYGLFLCCFCVIYV